MMRLFVKKIRSLLFRLYIKMAEKHYERLRYLLQTNHSSDTLVVCFSGFGNGGSAKYNYINTLKKAKANKLFILDDFGYNKQGSYYLGENGNWFLPDMVVGLIQKVQNESNIKNLVMVGSSKGGSAALFYSIKMGANACVIGAPQYFIGNYLSIDKHLPILKGIMGNTSTQSIQRLNRLMCDCIQTVSTKKPKVYIHYSPKEHTYPDHIIHMIDDLVRCGYAVVEDAGYDYTDHKEVAKYFPLYLLSILSKL